MADGIWTALSGLRVREQRMANLANNLANANTVGFRRQVLLSREHRSSPEHRIAEQAPSDMTLRKLPQDHAMVVSEGSQMREEEGALSLTKRPLDIAINGAKGYFVVEDEQGNELLTRDGRFKISAENELQTIDGAKVLSDGGAISIPPKTKLADLRVLPDGNIVNGVTTLGRLRLGYAPPERLEAMGNNRFRANEVEPAEGITVVQGYQELSTVNAVQAMVNLISAHRGFDANMKLLSSYKELDQEAIQLLK